MIAWQDMREWLKVAQELGEVKILEGADLDLELSGIAQINAKNQGPAILFNKIKGHENSGFRVLVNSVGNEKLFNLTFGGNIENTIQETIESLMGKPNQWVENAPKYPVKFVDSGHILENVETEGQVDLMKFPTPFWHEKDGGPFIGTGVAVITEDPDTHETNVGSYRAQLYSKNRVGINAERGKHGSFHRDKYFSQGKPMPVVMVFGPSPLLYVLAGSEVPTGVSELEYEGAIREAPVRAIKGKYTGLPIPADAEIAIEGFVYPDRTMTEGPHGEWTGYYASDAKEKPFVEVQGLYYRNDAIMLGTAMSKGSYNDHAFWRSIWRSALIYDEMVKNGLPGIKGVYTPPFGVGRQFINVSIKQSYPGHATEAGYLASQTRSAAYMGKWVVVVDDDVNPYDMDDVLWAMCSRADPADIGIIKKAWASGVDPLRPRDLPASKYTNSRAIVFATVPFERMDDFPPTCMLRDDLRKDVYEKWKDKLGTRWSGF